MMERCASSKENTARKHRDATLIPLFSNSQGKTMIQIHKKLNEDWFIGIDDRDEFWVCDQEEGDRLFAIPESMRVGKGGFSLAIIGPALIDVAILISLARDDWFERGKRAGADQQRKEFQHVLGLDHLERIAEAIEEIAGRS